MIQLTPKNCPAGLLPGFRLLVRTVRAIRPKPDKATYFATEADSDDANCVLFYGDAIAAVLWAHSTHGGIHVARGFLYPFQQFEHPEDAADAASQLVLLNRI